jgi:hypothetical protein
LSFPFSEILNWLAFQRIERNEIFSLVRLCTRSGSTTK